MNRAAQSDRALRVIEGAVRSNARRGPVVMVHPADGFVSERCVRAAAEVARLLHGEVLGVGRAPPQGEEESLNGLTEAAAARFEELMTEFKIDGRWRKVTRPALRASQDFAHEADLIVTQRGDTSTLGFGSNHVRDLVKTTGRPVLACATQSPIRVDCTLICWNDHPEARRAAADALPLLRRSSLSIILLVCESIGRREVEARARSVERGFKERGVNARAIVRAFGKKRLAEVVADVADEEDADLVVAGAYGRGPVWRTLTGSHTDALLATVNRPLFLSH